MYMTSDIIVQDGSVSKLGVIETVTGHLNVMPGPISYNMHIPNRINNNNETPQLSSNLDVVRFK